MKIWGALSNAVRGWVMILRGEAGWREHFSLTLPGMVTALVVLAFVAFLAVMVTSIGIGMPAASGVIAAIVVLALPVISLLVTFLATRLAMASTVSSYEVMVPGTYALTAFVVLEGILALTGGPLVMLSWLVMAFLIYRLARAATGWNMGVSAGFAVLTVVLLVAVRLALYMLSTPAVSPI